MGAEVAVEEFGRHFIVLLIGVVSINRNGTVAQFIDKAIEALATHLTIAIAFVNQTLRNQSAHTGACQPVRDKSALTPVDAFVTENTQPPLQKAVTLPPS